MQLQSLLSIALVGCAALTAAHPGQHEERDEASLIQKRAYQANVKRSLEKCSRQLEARGVNKRADMRRRETVEKLRRNMMSKRLTIRDPETVLNKSHEVTDGSITINSPESVIFSDNSTCVLNPEGETGPFYVLGEYVRSDVSDGEEGVPLTLDAQFLDVETCEPITSLWFDLWNCNSTGVYSGVVSQGNGNADDTSNLDATFLRGIQKTDDEGVVQFTTVFPGHYSGRTTHHHVVGHIGNVTQLSNNTITGGTVAHIGQLFWDQDLIYEVEATSPYNTNNITITTNADDHVFDDETEDSTSDPVINYVRVGDTIGDGIFGWITIAVNQSATYDPNYSFVLTSGGGVAESGGDDSGAPGGSGPP
ncbi:uncharacterized protein TRUGW13939_05948 [Talaromyces rugulosus]|uniref:Intradiol ring-cleavage dioxygenases domain-containing protein n=1 Tax=Talaromyces rugulosus TaxID=121627 RepID=A0A7H8QXJ4_TALRU|nr:uncharacterized protein TRUGW13939_05948 [Talaromyces rugulosus]QKX58820.1 hypothetical protein TRUGW13939_05948 [Talaromyces rugulosus]